MTFTENRKPKTENLRIFLTGVGGQGTLLASRLLGEAALAAGYNPMVSETHGMAQRGGIVVSTVVLGDLKSPLISPGEADIVLAFEALEAFRALDRCHARTLVIANAATIVPYPVAIGQAKYPPVERMFGLLAAQVGGLLAFDAGARAREAGSPLAVNMVLLGALTATDYLLIPAADLVALIRTRTKEKFLASNLQAFELGAEAARNPGNWLRREAA
ncbi:MAG: indolepyruvate oxidoreductase subunit beta [Syntrophobacterales bacterium]|jgi:indolepyruvate ferredoxin oxidoreductase beta subunit|nr:indolepyruvate oxidoreductase subunit beta [Syntrophobacterales bacterium]